MAENPCAIPVDAKNGLPSTSPAAYTLAPLALDMSDESTSMPPY